MARPREDPTQTFDVGSGRAGQLRFLPAERWKLRRLIGRGGQADVWLAEDLELEQPVVLKVFHRIGDPVAVERMRREVRLGRELHHPGLVRLFDLVEMNGSLVAVMEWIPGGSLSQEVAENGPLPVDRVVEIVGQVLETLAYLHREGVIHRDIKPSNLLLADDGRVLLGDLGLARRLAGDSDLTRTLTTVGTPAYMAPEQLRGEEVGPAADLYSLGVTVFQLLTGETPFAATTEFEMADAILHRRVRPLRSARADCPRWFATFVDRLLERSPADRFANGGAALAAFERRRAVGSRRRRRWLAAGLAAAALVLGAGLAVSRYVAAPAPLDHVEELDGQLVAYDVAGHELWRRASPIHANAVVADVVGSPEPEVVVDHVAPQRHDHSKVSLDIIGRSGEVTGTVTLQEGPRLLPFTTVADWALTELGVADVDGDGFKDLVWTIGHRVWFPAALGVWAPRGGHGPANVLINSGSFGHFVAADLDGDGADEIVA
ncbi:MAG TPA: serine/threonine protein kinase, partial [Acidobacteria bacterium]|nr:serine/threonine protein kinase [Acidobacteriota bacterium]